MVLEGHRRHVWNITGFEAHKHHHLRNLSTLQPRERDQILTSYPKFLYVRHPFVRLVSAYRNKIAPGKFPQGKAFRNIAQHIASNYRQGALMANLEAGGSYNVTWDEWIRYLTDPSETDRFNEHWMEYYKLCFPCKIEYDFIGNLETVQSDSAYMLGMLGLHRVSYPTGPALSNNLYSQYFANLSQKALEKLWEIYKVDFELFGFEKPDLFK